MSLRVIQWGTGSVGAESLRAILDSAELELVGVKVFSEDKDGADAGSLAGREPVGILATADVDTILAAEADCVAYMPRTGSVAEVCALLSSGKNVVTTAFLFHPERIAAPDREALRDACTAGGATLHGTGLNPGNLSAALPFALSGMSRTIERLTLQERADWSAYESTSITFDQMRFGQPPDEVTEARSESLARTSGLFQQQVWLLADTLDAAIDEVTTTLEVVPAQHAHVIGGRELAVGTVAGQRWRWSGRRDGATLVEIEALWTVGGEDPPDWPTPQHGWTLTVEGEPSMQVHFISLASFERRASMAEHVAAANIATAMQAVNAITAVCAAPPGFATAATLPPIRSARGFGRPG
jgi:hypothetical protein